MLQFYWTIAAILLDKEDPNRLTDSDHDDHWYRYFFNHIVNGKQWAELDLKEISIVTFNYDRSFEHYLAYALASAYGVSKLQAFEKILQIEIIHVYGSLGSCNPTESDYVAYGYGKSSEAIKIAASRLKVIPEGRQNDEALARARDALLSSERIAFLGFGFDKANLERLDSTKTCCEFIDDDPSVKRFIVASTYGMTRAERYNAGRLTINKNIEESNRNLIRNFGSTKCLMLLRETGILPDF